MIADNIKINKNFPRVIFQTAPLDLDVNVLKSFLFDSKNNWNNYIFKKHPNLKKINDIKNIKAKEEFLSEYIKDFNIKNKNVFSKNIEKYQKIWDKKEQNILNVLSEIIGEKWPQGRESIHAMLSINPICPRFLEAWGFSLFYNYKNPKIIINISAHEICHFLYFEKFKKLFPKVKKEKFEYPHKEWLLSELVAPIILNDPRLRKYLPQKEGFYPEHKNLKINGVLARKYLAELYNKNKKNDLDEFLKEGYEFIKQ